MTFVVFLQLVAVYLMVGTAYGFGSGAPTKACESQMPGHSVDAQSTTNPYTITVSAATYNYSNPQPITVTVTGTFKGLLLQARSTGDSKTPIGVFSSAPTDTKVVKCTSDGDSWTHANTNNKTSAAITWTPPSANAGDIVFQATVAQEKDIFWMNTRSNEVKAVGNSDNNNGGRVTSGIIMALTPLVLLFV